jgi:hypothetical protein
LNIYDTSSEFVEAGNVGRIFYVNPILER